MKTVLLILVLALGSNARAEIVRCNWQPTARPTTFLEFDPQARQAMTVAGFDDPTCLATGGRYSDSSGNVNPRTGGRVITPLERQCRRVYSDIQIITGLPPYYDTGLTLLAFGDVPLAHLRLSFNGKTWYERDVAYPFEAYYAIAPGNPDPPRAWAPTRGVCWTGYMPPVTEAQP